MTDTSGFYRLDENKALHWAKNAVTHPDGAQLLRNNPAQAVATAPVVNGWHGSMLWPTLRRILVCRFLRRRHREEDGRRDRRLCQPERLRRAMADDLRYNPGDNKG